MTFVDREIEIERYLKASLLHLQGVGEVHRADAAQWLKGTAQPFDIVFLDPPFAADAISGVCEALEARRWLAPDALIYIECPAQLGAPQVPSHWSLVKSKTTGQVGYHLARRRVAEPS